MSKWFVSGAGGYIGMILCQKLVAAGHEVTAFDRYFFEKTPDGCNIVRGDTRTIGREVLAGHDVAVDLAGLSNDASCEIDEAYTIDINQLGGAQLAHQTRKAGIPRYIYASSASVYGFAPPDRLLTETDKLNPLTAYSKSKVAIEGVLQHLKSETFCPVILRNATVFGVSPRMRFDLAVNAMVARAWKDHVVYIMGGGDQWRPFIHVEDVAKAIMWAAQAPTETVAGQAFNVGSDSQQCSIHALAARVRSLLPDVTIHSIPDNPDNRSYRLSFQKFTEASGFKRLRSIEDGIFQVWRAIVDGVLDPSDPSTITLNWYKSIIEWDKRLNALRFEGKLL